MNKIIIVSLTATLMSTGAYAGGSFTQMINDTGCDSNHTDSKKEQIFNASYLNSEMTVSGTVNDIKDDNVYLKVLPETHSFDVVVRMASRAGLDDLDKGSRVTLRFSVSSQGGCIIAFHGVNGTIVH